MFRILLIQSIALCVFLSGLVHCFPHLPRCELDSGQHTAYGHWASRMNSTHKLSLLTPALHQHSFRNIADEELLAENTAALAGSTGCPHSPLSSLDEPLMARSLCPWYWKVNYNARRIPAVLPEAVCRCRQAVTGLKGMAPYQCQPLTMAIRVLQMDQSCQNYDERTVELAVACVTVVQSAVKMNKIEGVQHSFNPNSLPSLQEVK